MRKGKKMSEFYDSIDRTFRNELNFYDPRFVAYPISSYDTVLQYCLSDITATEALFNTIKEKTDSGIERVIFNPPATIVFFNDGKKVVVKCQEDDNWDEEKALAMAIVKHDYGLSEFNKILDKAERRYPNVSISESDLSKMMSSIASAMVSLFSKCEDDEEEKK